MDKSSVTWTKGSDWWLSRTTMGGKERYPKQIRVGDLDRPRVYYPVDRDALLEMADEMQGYADGAASGDGFPYVNAGSLWSYADRIREACGEAGR